MNRSQIGVRYHDGRTDKLPTWSFTLIDKQSGHVLDHAHGFLQRGSVYGEKARDAVEIAIRRICGEPPMVFSAGINRLSKGVAP